MYDPNKAWRIPEEIMVGSGYDIIRNEGEISVTLKAADPYGLVQSSILAMGSLLTNAKTSGMFWEASCLLFAGNGRNELLGRLWAELLYHLRHDQLSVVKATVAEFTETKLAVECFFSTEFTPGSLLLGPEWLTGHVASPSCAEIGDRWVATIIWHSAS
ncbi:MAG: hypothetical protein LBU12_09395 [Deltaproteobacteria bacterium]|nr:hypothetical protein [Deltaproteobacteria bacterium]